MPEQESICQYRSTCHFYNMKNMTPANQRPREIYCIECPQKCAINQAKVLRIPVTITLWPTGQLEA